MITPWEIWFDNWVKFSLQLYYLPYQILTAAN